MKLLRVLHAYHRTRRLRFASRAALLAHQQQAWARYSQQVLVHSPYFSPFIGQPLHTWPLMDKSIMMAEFDRMNTAGLHLADLWPVALAAEQTRDFESSVTSPSGASWAVGLSSGTSGQRGLFVVSAAEQAQWAGTMLAKLLDRGLLRGERVAFFLRANSALYESIKTPCLSFAFFDLMAPFDSHAPRLAAYAPTIVVAPAQVLVALARRTSAQALSPRLLVSVAEVLTPDDLALLQARFGPHGRVGQVYQATEGCLASTCAHGHLHLHEEFVHIEKDWIDAERYVPIVTDFTRRTQPIVRYRLNDVLVHLDDERSGPCPCGNVAHRLQRIEGRCDDILLLPAAHAGEPPLQVFADVLHRMVLQALPAHTDYLLVQTGACTLTLHAALAPGQWQSAQATLNALLHAHGVNTTALQWQWLDERPAARWDTKRRRIVRRWMTDPSTPPTEVRA